MVPSGRSRAKAPIGVRQEPSSAPSSARSAVATMRASRSSMAPSSSCSLAIACGVVEGRGLGQNARAALIARGFAEMTRFGLARGARAETLAGLSGLGDLVLTCSSTSSRNFSLGKGLGQGRPASELMADRRTVAEGAFTAPVLRRLAEQEGVDMPIVAAVYRLLHGAPARDIVAELLARPLGAETDA